MNTLVKMHQINVLFVSIRNSERILINMQCLIRLQEQRKRKNSKKYKDNWKKLLK